MNADRLNEIGTTKKLGTARKAMTAKHGRCAAPSGRGLVTGGPGADAEEPFPEFRDTVAEESERGDEGQAHAGPAAADARRVGRCDASPASVESPSSRS